jgi:hypothetical protein
VATLLRERPAMRTNRLVPVLGALACACLAVPAYAADRVHAGQWTGTTTAAGRTYSSSSCLTQADANAMNGDAQTIQAYLERTIPPSICKLSAIKATGNQVSYATACRGGAPAVVTTAYHGDSFETVDTKGTKSIGRRVGACH